MTTIATIHAREIYDSRGTPTVETDVVLSDGSFGRASVPSGASTGDYEAIELRDITDTRLHGKGVRLAVSHVNRTIAEALIGKVSDIANVDETMVKLDGTENKSALGANAILSVSLAIAKANAMSQKIPLYQFFRSLSVTAPREWIMPVPMMNVLNGGRHADKSSDFQEYMIVPVGAKSFSMALEMGVSIFMALKNLLHTEGYATTVGDEGGFAPSLHSNEKPIEKIQQAVAKAGYSFGNDVVLAIDIAASEFYENNEYALASEAKKISTQEMIELLGNWVSQYPIISIEDPLEQNAWEGYASLTKQYGDKVQIVGDDLFVTNVTRLQKGIQSGCANAILIKLNQIGTVTETIAAIDLARKNNFNVIVSHRSGETEDVTIADLAVGLGIGQIKTGSLCRTDRMAKYNQLLRIEEAVGKQAIYLGKNAFVR